MIAIELDVRSRVASGEMTQQAADEFLEGIRGGPASRLPSKPGSRFAPGTTVPGSQAGLPGSEGLAIEFDTGTSWTPSAADAPHVTEIYNALGTADDVDSLGKVILEGVGFFDSGTGNPFSKGSAEGKDRREAAFNKTQRILTALGNIKDKEGAKRYAAQIAVDIKPGGPTLSRVERKFQEAFQAIFRAASRGDNLDEANRRLRKLRNSS